MNGGKCVVEKIEIRKWKGRFNTEVAEVGAPFGKHAQGKQRSQRKEAATRERKRASILAKAEPRPVEDVVDCLAAAFVC
jgi:hypothetical protein